MKVTSSAQGDATVITVSGEFGAELVSKFQQAVAAGIQSGRRDFLVDLTSVRSLDSAALEALTGLQRKAEEQLGMLRICVKDSGLRKVFEITRLDQRLTIDACLEDSLSNFGFATVAGGRP